MRVEGSVQTLPVKRPIFRYALLTLLFTITAAYEIPYLYDILRDGKRDVAFFSTESGTNTINSPDQKARDAGLRPGDQILAVNGEPYRGVGDWFGASRNTPVGGNIQLDILSTEPANPGAHRIVLTVRRANTDYLGMLAAVALHVVLPGISVLLGFWVAFSRPRDPMAWLLLALMLTFPHFVGTFNVQGWPPGWREAAIVYRDLLGKMVPPVMFLFGRFFPEPFPKRSVLERIWRVLQWAMAVPYTILAIISVIISTGDLSNYHSVAQLQHATKPFAAVAGIFAFLLIGSFFSAMGFKYGMTRSRDAKRRLRILLTGTAVAWTPGLFLTFYVLGKGKSILEAVSQWTIILALLPLILFPVTLAYVIVVEKAMDVSMVIRQGLQYALARNGSRVLQAALVIAVIVTAFNAASDMGRNQPQKIAVIVAGTAAVFLIRRSGDRLRGWIDRRFFREAYDAEQVLTQLSDEVRSMVEPKSLLQMVASRISQTLHVPQVAVLLAAESYHSAFAMGYSDLSDVQFASNAGIVNVLRRQKEPARVYLENRDSWLYREENIDDSERGKLAQLGAELLLPLAVRDKLLGFISLGPKRSEEPYIGSDVRLLKSVAAQTGLALENVDLMRKISNEVAQRERLNREVEIAREVQERLFPQKLPAIEGLDYSGYCRPALAVGGDYYDFLALPQGHLGVAIGDVSGKGIAAALMMASLQASLRGEATRAPENLAAAVANVNRLVYEASAENRYATFFYGQYDPVTREFNYVNAGHNPPMLFHCANGQWLVTRLEAGGTVVGLLESYPYEQGSVTVAPGDLLVAFTDGISEAMNQADEEWGEERLIACVERCRGMNAKEVVQSVFQEADAFVSGAKQHDDMTLVVLHALETAPSGTSPVEPSNALVGLASPPAVQT
jgi:sigma-B regulation protein RsbU (phosphoserine phosphatase)